MLLIRNLKQIDTFYSVRLNLKFLPHTLYVHSGTEEMFKILMENMLLLSSFLIYQNKSSFLEDLPADM